MLTKANKSGLHIHQFHNIHLNNHPQFKTWIVLILNCIKSSQESHGFKYQTRNNFNFQNFPTFRYETSDGTKREETAELKNVGTDQEALVVRGTIRWIAADGQEYTLNYIADENGFQPQGDHLPK